MIAMTIDDVRAAVASVPDPELPVVTIEDLGILRAVDMDAGGSVVVTITPTYSGCPAMGAIVADVRATLAERGVMRATVRTVLSPAWSTDWITTDGRRKLAEAGIAPPGPAVRGGRVAIAISPRCPQCGAADARLVSRFGSTACKAIYVCRACQEPFDHVKAI